MPTEIEVHYIEDKPRLLMFLGPHGPVGRDLGRRGDRLADLQRTGAPRRSGRLAEAISAGRVERYHAGLEILVGVHPGRGGPRGYALYQAKGTRAHDIRPRSPRGHLAFRVAGRIVYANRVRHPGTRPDPYLTRFLAEAIR